MDIGAFHSFSIFTPFHVNLPDASTRLAEWTIGVRSLHSQGNIQMWSSYLPRPSPSVSSFKTNLIDSSKTRTPAGVCMQGHSHANEAATSFRKYFNLASNVFNSVRSRVRIIK
jgi:hypothetical protein